MRPSTPRSGIACGVAILLAALTTNPFPVSAYEHHDVRTGAPAYFEPLRHQMRQQQPTPGVPMSVAEDLARRINRIERLTRALATNNGFLRSADDGILLLLFNRVEGKGGLLRAYAASFGAAPVPEDLFTHLDMALDALWEEITRLASTYPAPAGGPLMGSLSTALERKLRVIVPKATFVGGMMRDREWKMRLNALGLPERRSMKGVLYYRIPDQPWLICREFQISQRYFKRDPAKGPGEITFGSLRLQQSV